MEDASLPIAIKQGNFLSEFGIDVNCYVLNDKQRTAVITSSGMATAIGIINSNSKRISRLADRKSINEFVNDELKYKLDNPIEFYANPQAGEHNNLAIRAKGYDVTILIDLCKAIIDSERSGKLHPSQLHIARQAHIIINASAKAGIKGLVYALAAYDAERAEIIESFKTYIREEAREYEREFPEALYEQWYRLYGLKQQGKNRPWKFKHLTVEHVYYPLAKSNGIILNLVQEQRGEDKHKRLHQFLNQVGVKALRQHLGALLALATISRTAAEYERNVHKMFSEQQEFDF